MPQVELLRALEQRGVVRDQIAEIFHMLRRVGNKATHDPMSASPPSGAEK